MKDDVTYEKRAHTDNGEFSDADSDDDAADDEDNEKPMTTQAPKSNAVQRSIKSFFKKATHHTNTADTDDGE